MSATLTRLLAERQSQVDFITHLLEKVETDNRDLVDAERSNIEAARERITEIDAQVKPIEEYEATRAAHEESRSNVTPTRPRGDRPNAPTGLGVQAREVKYGSAGEFVVDYLKARGQRMPNGQELGPDLDARQRVEASLGRSLAIEERIAHQTTTDTPGLLPEPIVGQIITDIDGSRPLVNSVGAKPLGVVSGKTFRRPIVTQHTQVGEQLTEKSELASRKLVIDDIEMTKKTFGGALNISRQDIDWTSPGAWNAIITDLQLVYGMETEDWAADVLAAAVTQEVEIALADKAKLSAWITALYDAATKAATANGTKRASSLRLPNTIWTSIDMWGSLGAMLSTARSTNFNASGKAAPTSFAGDILDINRVVVPGLPTGTFIIGRSDLFEFYEERIGLLSAIEPSVLGIEVAYGGYVAAGALDATAFSKVTVAAA